MARIRLHEGSRTPPYKKDIVVRGGNHHMDPDDIHIRIPYAQLVERGLVKDGEEPDSSAVRAVRNALKVDVKELPGDRFGPDYEMTISLWDIAEKYKLESYWYNQVKRGFISWLLDTHLTIRPEDPLWEAALNRITMKDARRKCAALQKSGKLTPCLHEVTAAIALVQNALANSSPEIKDNTLNSTEKKIVARAVLAEIVSNFNYDPEDLR